MRKIMVLSANDAERGLLEPVCRRIGEREDLKLIKVDISPIAASFESLYAKVEHLLFEYNPDIVLVPCDRREMLPVAACAFYNNFCVAHFDAGEVFTNSPDDITRACISRFSHILLANTHEAEDNLVYILGEEPFRVHVVGFTCVDDIQPTERDILLTKYNLPDEFDVMLLHPDSYSEEMTANDLSTASIYLDKFTVIFYPNNDPYSKLIREWINERKYDANKKILERVPRNDFIGMLKHCQRYLGNSSAACYEASYFGTNCVQIGLRNAMRNRIKPEPGASDRIVEILATTELNEKLMRKGFRK